MSHDIDRFTRGDEQPDVFTAAMDGSWKAPARLRDEAVVKAIGVGVNEWEVWDEALRQRDFDCFLLAGRYTLLEQDPLDRFLPLCEERGAVVVVGGGFNSGILATGGLAVLVEAVGAVQLTDDVDAEVIVEVLSDPWQVGGGSDPVCAQMIGRAKAGEHHQPGRADRSRGQDHLAVDADGLPLAILDDFHPRRAPTFHHDSGDHGIGAKRQVPSPERRMQVAHRRPQVSGPAVIR